jgi:hypothetical protein
MRGRRSILLRLLGVFAIAAPLYGASRHVAVILDTSGSMQQNDRPRYTMQLSQVLSDLVDSGDQLSIVRMPPDLFSSCAEGPSSSLVLRLDPSDRARFKRDLDALVQFNTGTYFAAPVRTAISLLPPDPSARRMLLIIADAGGLGMCEGVLTQELLDFKRGGVTIAAINLGGTAGAFDSNPAFDFTTSALNAQGLIEAVALVYQRFLGAKQVQTGRVQDEVVVDVAPYVDNAFLVVAADGPTRALEQEPGNPGAAAVDLNHRGGGETRGLDGIVRGYRIARLERPAAGRWRFRVIGAGPGAGWMLLQETAVGVRLLSPTIPKDANTPIEVELFDQRTGQRIADTSKLPGLQVTLDVDGQAVSLHDDGQNGDRQANDGVLSATTTFRKAGDTPVTVHLQSQFLDQKIALTAHVIDASWRLDVRSPNRAEVDHPVALSVALEPIGSTAFLRAADHVNVVTGGGIIELRDDGKGADRQSGDRIYTADWTPSDPGMFHLDYVPVGGSPALQASAPLEVLGRLRFGSAVPIQLGRLTSKSTGTGQLDLRSADVRGDFELKVTTPFARERSVLEIDLGSRWVPLDRDAQTLHVSDAGRRAWPLRLRVGECPEGHPAGKPIELVVAGIGADGRAVTTTIPVRAEIVPDHWLHCWWPVIAAGAGLLAVAIIIHGYWIPSRFPARLGVVLSPEEDLTEGFLHPIRGERGSRSGFYRDARIYVCNDFRLASQPRNAVARLRADRKQVRIAPAAGAAVWRQNAEGTWEQIPPDESTARFGDVYRNDLATLFFELRNA